MKVSPMPYTRFLIIYDKTDTMFNVLPFFTGIYNAR